MEKYDERVDAYIDKSAEFAKPILKHIRELVHKASPEITETIKWGFASFDYKGPVCSMAAFKQHCSFGFWKTKLIPDPYNLLTKSDEAMGQLGKISALTDLPDDDILVEYIRNAVRLNEQGIKNPVKKPVAARIEIQVPAYFAAVLEKHPLAKEKFDQFSYSHRKEYIEWITEAKTEPTREKRIATTIEWLTEGKSRNWKYQK
jgi:uncharacterized protein YdeI (YjbR/CyaY-like superfamily)